MVRHGLDDILYKHGWRSIRDVRMLLFPMNGQGWTLRETLATYRADVWAHLRVREKVHLAAGRAPEGFAADVAEIRLLAGVLLDVLLQGGLASQLHAALFAHVLLLVLQHMAVQILLRLQPLLAHRALEPRVFDAMLVVLVEVEGHLVGQRAAAHVADARVALVRNQVLCIVGLDAEFPVAFVTREVKVVGVLAREMYLQRYTPVRHQLAAYHRSSLKQATGRNDMRTRSKL